MAYGDSNDFTARLKTLIPVGWFATVAPIRDAVFGGLSDSLAFLYSFIIYAKAQMRIATATGIFLDIIAFDYLGLNLQRKTGEIDSTYRLRIVREVLRARVTRQAMKQAMIDTTGNVPNIFEPWNTNDTGCYAGPLMGWGIRGGWGNMGLPGQFFMQVTRGQPSGVPGGVTGYLSGSSYFGGYGVGFIEYIGPLLTTVGITDADILNVIVNTKPTGTIAWVQFIGKTGQPPAMIFESTFNSQDLIPLF